MSGSGDRLVEIGRQHITLPGGQRRIHIRTGIKCIGHVILVIGAVRDVIIHKKVRQPPVPQLQESARLRRIGLQVIAIQIQVLRLRAPAHLLGSVLIDAVVKAEALMAVGVVNRDDQHHGAVEQRRFALGDHHVAQQRQAGIFAIHLAGVDGVLNEHNGTVRLVQRRRIEDPVFGNSHHIKIAVFARLAEGFYLYLLGSSRCYAPHVGHGLVIAGRGEIVGNFRGCAPVDSWRSFLGERRNTE